MLQNGQKEPFADDVQSRCSKNFCKIHRKTAVWKSLFWQSARPETCNFIRSFVARSFMLVRKNYMLWYKNDFSFFYLTFKDSFKVSTLSYLILMLHAKTSYYKEIVNSV